VILAMILLDAVLGAIVALHLLIGANAAPDPQAVNLALNELPAGYTQTLDKPESGPQFEVDHPAAIGEMPGLQSFDDRLFDFKSQQSGGVPSFTYIQCMVALYKSGDDALAAYNYRAAKDAEDNQALRPDLQSRPVSFGTFGSVSTASTSTLGSGQQVVVADSLLFQRGRYWVDLSLSYTADRTDASLLPSLASAIDARIKLTT
jgi:hypothetical protein